MRTLTKTQMNALKKVCETNPLRPVMESIFHENGRMIATDGHILVVIDAMYDKSLEGKIIHKKTGQEMEGRYPNYKAVIPSEDITEWLDIDGEKLFEGAKRLRNVKSTTHTVIEVNGVAYSANKLFTVMNILKNPKDLKFRREINREDRPLTIESEGFTALVMAVMKPDDINEANRENISINGFKTYYSIDEAAEFEPFRKTIIALKNGEIMEGEVVGVFSKYGREYEIVNTKHFTHSVYKGVVQEMTGFRYDEFDALIETTPEHIEVVDFDIPKDIRMDVMTKKGGKIALEKKKIERIYRVKGILIFRVEDKPFKLFVYGGYAFSMEYGAIEQLNNMSDPQDELERFIEREYK